MHIIMKMIAAALAYNTGKIKHKEQDFKYFNGYGNDNDQMLVEIYIYLILVYNICKTFYSLM